MLVLMMVCLYVMVFIGVMLNGLYYGVFINIL